MKKHRVCTLQLVSGCSKERDFTLSSAMRRAVFRVGTALECNWRVHGEGVADHHFMLMWNGSILSVVDVGAPNLRVNGESIVLSTTLFSGRIDFGSAAMIVDQCLQAVPVGKLGAKRQSVAHKGAQKRAADPRQQGRVIAKA